MRIPITLAAIALFAVQCKKHKQVAAEPDRVSNVVQTTAAVPGIKVQEDGGANEASDQFTLNDARISGDTLLVDVSYGGGCKEHDFELYSNGMWMKSMPPKMNLRLVHHAHEDNCRAYITKTYKFLVDKAKYNGQPQVVLLLDGGGDQRSLNYRYP